MKNVKSKIYDTYSIYGDKLFVKRKRVSNIEYDAVTIDDAGKRYSIERLQGKAELEEEENFDWYLRLAQHWGYKQVDRAQLGGNECVLKRQMNITNAELKVLFWCIKRGIVSIPDIQHYWRYGFGKAEMLLEWMAQRGYLDSSNLQNGKHKVTLTEEQFNAIYKQN